MSRSPRSKEEKSVMVITFHDGSKQSVKPTSHFDGNWAMLAYSIAGQNGYARYDVR
jgi:hypothetical protein